jgi:hypothetical protein
VDVGEVFDRQWRDETSDSVPTHRAGDLVADYLDGDGIVLGSTQAVDRYAEQPGSRPSARDSIARQHEAQRLCAEQGSVWRLRLGVHTR